MEIIYTVKGCKQNRLLMYEWKCLNKLLGMLSYVFQGNTILVF